MKVSNLQVAAGALSYLLAGGNIGVGLANQDPMSTVTGVVWACTGTVWVVATIKNAKEANEKQTNEKPKTR